MSNSANCEISVQEWLDKVHEGSCCADEAPVEPQKPDKEKPEKD